MSTDTKDSPVSYSEDFFNIIGGFVHSGPNRSIKVPTRTPSNDETYVGILPNHLQKLWSRMQEYYEIAEEMSSRVTDLIVHHKSLQRQHGIKLPDHIMEPWVASVDKAIDNLNDATLDFDPWSRLLASLLENDYRNHIDTGKIIVIRKGFEVFIRNNDKRDDWRHPGYDAKKGLMELRSSMTKITVIDLGELLRKLYAEPKEDTDSSSATAPESKAE